MKCVIVPAGVKGSHIKSMYPKKKDLFLIASNSVQQNIITSIINQIRHEKFTKGIIEMAVTMTNLNKKNTRIIIGNPGCGKTTKLISELQKLYQEGTPLERIAYCSFSVAAIDEAVSRALKALKISTTTSSATSKLEKYTGKLIYFKTLHAMAFRLLGLDSSSLLSETGMKDFARSQGLRITGDYIRKKGLPHRMTSGDKIMQIIGVSELCNKSIRDYMVENNIHEIPINIVEKVAHNYKAFKILNSQYDYTDMLIMAKNTDIEVPELDYLFIDEAQDLSSLQWILVNKLASKAEHIVISGDDKQCQPAGSKVLTTKGFKDIENLNEDTDRLVSYAKHDACCYNNYPFKIKKQKYKGPLYTINTPIGSFNVTAGHIHMVKWNNKDLSKNVVYLMQKGDYFRVGWCQLFNSNGSLHLGERWHKEDADKAWILRMCNSKQEASIYESILATNYRLPLVPFTSPHGTNYYTPDALNKIFKSIPNQRERALNLLHDLGKEIGDPFLQRGKRNRHGATIFEVTTRNLEQEMMQLPQRGQNNKDIHWVPIENISVNPDFDGFVYGLDVDKYHTYVTDNGIITHNCVNEFSGADVDTFLSLPGRVETLKQSYRTPKLVYDAANKLVEKMTTYRKEGAVWRPRRIEGTYNIVSSLPLDKIQKGGDWLILARGGYQLQTLANELYKIEADQKPILFTLNNMPPIDLDAYAIIWLYKRYNKDMIRNLVSPPDSRNTPDQIANKKKYQRILNKFIRNAFPLEEAANKGWHEIFVNEDPVKLRYLQKTYPLYESYGDEMFKKATVRLMTIHSAKGREADNVVVYLNVPKTVSDTLRYDDSDIEIKVFYVAITRAKQNLYLYQDKKQRYSYYDLI